LNSELSEEDFKTIDRQDNNVVAGNLYNIKIERQVNEKVYTVNLTKNNNESS